MSATLRDEIDKTVKENKIVIYMKGDENAPMCGFSARALDVLKSLGEPIKAVNIFSDPQLRPELQKYSSWPTTPQIFINGKFVGGCDIIVEMAERGELKKLVGGA